MQTADRNTYLVDIPMQEAQAKLAEALTSHGRLTPLNGEYVPLTQALNRITAEPVWAKQSAPHYHASAMDGYAVSAIDTLNATETQPLQLELGTQAHPINTGMPLPADTNAVIMIEHTQLINETHIEIVASVSPWQHVRMMGEDIIATELVLPSSHKIRPVDLGAVAGCGHHRVLVRRKPQVTLIPTGSELVKPDEKPDAGQVIEYNSLVISGQLQNMGADPHTTDITPDDPDALANQIQAALDNNPDMILVLSGSSAGSKDFTSSVVRRIGTLLVHGVAVRPGHPVIMGISDSGVPIIGVPGYPVSAALTTDIFIEPIISLWLGTAKQRHNQPTVDGTLTQKLMSHTGDDDFVRVTVACINDRYLVTPIAKGAGAITSLVRADGILHVPRFSEGHNINAPVTVRLLRSPQEVDHSLLAMGSHDPMIDLLSEHLAEAANLRLTSANVGSMGGIIALKRGHAHFAGMHLLDEASGTYNVPYIEKHLKKQPVHLITFAHREQGFIVPKGNPKNIQAINDLTRVTFANRQRGAGTRQLLDYQLAQHGISPDDINGYAHEEYTHLAVAAAVATDTVDCGLGVRSAAIALDLDFIPLSWERYDIAIPTAYIDQPNIQQLLDILRGDTFKHALNAQPGYKTDETGVIQHVHTPN